MDTQTINDKRLNDFIQKYAIKHHISMDEASNHKMVQIAADYYRKNERIEYDYDK